jgi:hypothetical protein
MDEIIMNAARVVGRLRKDDPDSAIELFEWYVTAIPVEDTTAFAVECGFPVATDVCVLKELNEDSNRLQQLGLYDDCTMENNPLIKDPPKE